MFPGFSEKTVHCKTTAIKTAVVFSCLSWAFRRVPNWVLLAQVGPCDGVDRSLALGAFYNEWIPDKWGSELRLPRLRWGWWWWILLFRRYISHGYSVEEKESRKRRMPSRCQTSKGALFISLNAHHLAPGRWSLLSSFFKWENRALEKTD